MRTLLAILAVGTLAAHRTDDRPALLQHVKFQSSNFENILEWEGGPESTADTTYSVEYKTYGESEWLAKKGCQGITRKSCNLTLETGNLTELYYARVTAVHPGVQEASKTTERFSSLQHTTIKPPDVTCVPKVRSIQMIIHPTPTPILAGDGHQKTLEEIFQDLVYRLELHVNHTYKMHLGGKQREYEFVGLTPETEFLGTITISIPTWSKESAPYVCRVKTLPDWTWTYSFSGAILFSMGFLVAMLCYLSYRYITKPPAPPSSLDVQRVLTFQPLRFIQEHVLIPISDLSSPSSLAQPIQYSQVMVSSPREPPGAAQLHGLPEMAYLGQPDVSIFRPSNLPSPPTPSPPAYTPKAVPEISPPSYAPQTTPEAKAPFYAPQPISKVQTPSYTPQAALDPWPSSYGVCMEESGFPTTTLSSPRARKIRLKDPLQREAPAGGCLSGDFSLQEMTSLATEEPQEEKSLSQTLGVCTDIVPDLDTLHSGEPGTPPYLKDPLSLLSSVQIEGHPVSLPLHSPSFPCSSLDQGTSLLESLVCPKEEGTVPEARATCPGVSELEQPLEVDSIFKGLALTVQWES
ncbi:interleukin-22 receptor subunit alpha-1 isoform X2 [Perognathus longimembris pacificus]|uniref:interleukin-22 receptor subunit alpha-1 isoform X2 n=1 Tax=Perognathus longimembris pacificus TaxID=214514 RepID=UPI0020186043|nr:interleukin-22 receptor subunit alpha-1 isoform X2 [Perognathus longimembris pacificus]